MKMNLPSGFQLFLVFLAIIQFVVIVLIINYNKKNQTNDAELIEELQISNHDMSANYDDMICKTHQLERNTIKQNQEIEELRIRCATDSSRLSYYDKSIKGLVKKIEELKDSVNLYKVGYKNSEIENLNLKLQFQTIAKEAFTKTIQEIELNERIILLNKLLDDAESEYDDIFLGVKQNHCKYSGCSKVIDQNKVFCNHLCRDQYYSELLKTK